MMKYFAFFILILSITPRTQLVPVINYSDTSAFIDVEFLNEYYGFVVTNRGTLLRTTNTGLAWSDVPIPGNTGVLAVTSGPDGILFISGRNGMVKKSTDGGATWSDVSVTSLPDAALTFVKRIATYSLVVAGRRGWFARSDDNGLHWQSVRIGMEDINNVVFTGYFTAWALMDKGVVATTSDGGLTWSPFYAETLGKSVKGMLQSGNSIMFTGDGGLITSSENNGATWTSFLTWQQTDLVETKQTGQNSLFIMDTTGKMRTLTLTATGVTATNLTTQKKPQKRYYGFWSKSNTLYAITDGPNIYYSNSSGQQLSSRIVSLGGRKISSVTIVSENDYIISCNSPFINGVSSGYIARTTNGGESWKYSYDGGWVNREYYLSNGRGFRVLERSELYSSNSGATWSDLIANTSGVIISSQSLSDQTGYFIITDSLTKPRNKSASSIYKRTGSTKTMLKTFANTRLTHLDFIDNLNGWVLRDSTQFNVTTDGGVNWKQTAVITPYISSYLRFGNTSGILVTQTGRIMKTYNNTESWSLLFKDTVLRFNSIAGIDSARFIVAGDSGVICTSVDGGQSWKLLKTGIQADFNHIKMIDSRKFLITTTAGGVYKGNLDDSWYSEVKEPSPILPEYHIIGNFPNPFNNSTVIEFFTKESGNVQLTLFDISGREVYSDIINAQNGVNRYNFNSQNLNSGVYFYTLDFGGKKEYSKMILLK
ncbi:MAG: T9SS type A sorting domain-containing protein [Bacteroidetes bacterium]|nr:T9SS type A sorting domain-containing protein [Bacteroidota bacterium]